MCRAKECGHIFRGTLFCRLPGQWCQLRSMHAACFLTTHVLYRRARTLQLADVCPGLGQPLGTPVPMPAAAAAGATEEGPAELTAFQPAVHVLSSKTCPKKLGVLCSDGQQRSFLLKVGAVWPASSTALHMASIFMHLSCIAMMHSCQCMILADLLATCQSVCKGRGWACMAQGIAWRGTRT